MGTEHTQMRDYFERGCICINVDGTLTKLDPAVPDEEASYHYLTNCKCSRNLKPEDWQ